MGRNAGTISICKSSRYQNNHSHKLQTLVQGIELILNNRPIEVDYDDDQEDILSPNHLIFGRQLPTTKKSTQNSNSDLNLSKRKKMLQIILNYFWSRWRREYVTSLRQFQKLKQNKSAMEAIKKNDIVIIYDEIVPRHLWRLGRIVDIIPSRDCNIRAAKILNWKNWSNHYYTYQ